MLTFTRVSDGSVSVQGPIILPPDPSLASSDGSWFHTAPQNYPEYIPFPSGGFYAGPLAHTGPHPTTFPAVDDGINRPTPELPPLCVPDFPEGYQIADDAHARWEFDPGVTAVELVPPSFHCPIRVTEKIDDQGGGGQTEIFDSELNGVVNIIDVQSGAVVGTAPISLSGPVTTRVFGPGAGSQPGNFETEMVALSLSGDIPDGTGGFFNVQIRLDPQQNSGGQTKITKLGNGTYNVDSFFDVFTELSVNGGPFVPSSTGAARMGLGPPNHPGDLNGDLHTEVGELLLSFANFSGPVNDPPNPNQADLVDRRKSDGDNDADRDIDVGDLLESFGGFTGPPSTTGGNSENLGDEAGGDAAGSTTDRAGFADLIYDFTDGNVTLDASDAAILGFVLKNTTASFAAPGTATFPGGGVSTDLTGEISWADLTGIAMGSTHDLGDIFPTGLSLAGVESLLSAADTNAALGSPVVELDLIVVPEPASALLLIVSLLSLLAIRRR